MSLSNRFERIPQRKTENEREKLAEQQKKLAMAAKRECDRSARRTAEQVVAAEDALKHPDFPEALRGVEGLEEGDKILRERGEVGVLIGGLAEAIWNSKNSPEDLAMHKDVDILITRQPWVREAKPTKDFENFNHGIDWWIPQIDQGQETGRMINSWWQNGHGIVLPYKIELTPRFEGSSGLYLPGPEFALMMREATAYESAQQELNKLLGKYHELDENMPWDFDFQLDSVRDRYFDCEKLESRFWENFRERIEAKLEEEGRFNGRLMGDIRNKFQANIRESRVLEDMTIPEYGHDQLGAKSDIMRDDDPRNVEFCLTIQKKKR